MKKEEYNLQVACVTWFRLQYACYAKNLFAIPNGGSRNLFEAVNMKRSGTTAGVADLFLAVPKLCNNIGQDWYHGLFIELKINKRKPTESQIEFQETVEATGYKYVIIRNFDDFQKLINEYLK